MLNKISSMSILISVLSLTKGEPPNINYGTPIGTPISSYGTPSYQENDHNQHNHDYNGEPKSYEFGYQVKDDYTGTNYNRKEASDGNQVRGEYRVDLPDGRTQIVTYWADWQSGFHADVRYEGEARYPEQYNKEGGYSDGGYNGGGVSSQYGQPSHINGYSASSSAINNLAIAQDGNNQNDNFGSYNNGFHSKTSPSSVYGAV